MSAYVVVPAPGHFGDVGRVYSAHRTLEAARRAARRLGRGVEVRACASLRRGDRWLRVYAGIHPLA